MMRVCLVAAAAVLLCACRGGYDFHSTVLYEALQGHYQVLIESRGVVAGGHDVSQNSNGWITVSPAGPPVMSPPETAMIEVALRDSRLYFGSAFLPDDAGRDQYAEVMSQFLARYGYSAYPDEIEELILLIEGSLAGPKGTHTEGQTRAFKVISSHSE
jgi:hypothetical protein